MNNVSLILTIFLISAINTLVISIVVYIIFKIKNRKNEIETKEPEIKSVEKQEYLEKEPGKSLIEPAAQKPVEEKTLNGKVKDEEPKFLKYTGQGYIDSEKDKEKNKLIWK